MVYTLPWAGKIWRLRLDSASPGLARSDVPAGLVLAMAGLSSTDRRDLEVFDERNLTSVELFRERVQASYRPSGWGDLEVRASWGLTADGQSVDLEVQVSASSVGELRDVEVFVSSCPGGSENRSIAKTRFLVRPRNARSAAMTYDGREPSESLYELTTAPVPRPGTKDPGPIILHSGSDDDPSGFLEMVHPDDLSRRIVTLEQRTQDTEGIAVATRTALFGHDLEKGVVIRGRLRGRWFGTSPDPDGVPALQEFAHFLDAPPPLGT